MFKEKGRIFTIENALESLCKEAKWIIRDGVLEWCDEEIIQPTDAALQAEITRLQAEYDAKEYQRDRAYEYPSIQQQLDMQYWDSINNTTTWQDAINAVKANYPKPV